MIECTQCHIKYGSKLRQCPGCGHQRDLITDTPKKKITRSAYYQYIKSSWQHPFKTNWQWASGRFGWITIGTLLLINMATISLLVADWAQQTEAIAGVSTSYIVLRQPTALLPLNLRFWLYQLVVVAGLLGIGYLLKRFGGRQKTTINRYVAEVATYSGISLPVALIALIIAWFAGLNALILIGVLWFINYLILNMAIIASLLRTRTRIDAFYLVIIDQLCVHLAIVLVIGQFVLKLINQFL
ncbi:hypothetical protein [Latilactobacillus fuchuensis]|nr:hypothetical protein [Latilactobacillus fuchuensis]MCP8857343.1 hypothetical protein [Latilactobacillus fuchuensis]